MILLRVWRKGKRVIVCEGEGVSHEAILRTEIGLNNVEAVADGWQRIAFNHLEGESVMAIDAKDLESAHDAFKWAVKETGHMPIRVHHEHHMLTGKEVDTFYRYGSISKSNLAKWR